MCEVGRTGEIAQACKTCVAWCWNKLVQNTLEVERHCSKLEVYMQFLSLVHTADAAQSL